MKILRRAAIAAATATAVLLVLAAIAPAAAATSGNVVLPSGSLSVPNSGSFLYLISQPGDYVGMGQEVLYTGSANTAFTGSLAQGGDMFAATMFQGGLTHWWYVKIAAPPGVPLAVGSYEGAARADFRPPGTPGLDVYGEGRGCNTILGSFDVMQLAFTSTGQLLVFDATFEQHCEGTTAPWYPAALFGRIRIDNRPPPLIVTASTTLTEDHYGQVIIGADNVSLDCAGHNIIGSGWDDTTQTGDFAGVYLSERTGVTVRNCHISGFNEGIFLWRSSGNTIENNTTANTGNAGIDLTEGSSNNSVTGNRATEGDRQGFAVTRDSNANILSGNTASSNGGGFYVDAASDNRLTNNTADQNGAGIQVNDGGHGNVLTGNIGTRNHWFGLAIGVGAYGNSMIGNTASLNDQNGFSVNHDAHDNLISGNVAHDNNNGFDVSSGSSGNRLVGNRSFANVNGFIVNEASRNSFVNNTVTGNGGEGFGVGPSSDNNTFTGNVTSGGNHGFYLGNASNNQLVGNTCTQASVGIQINGGGGGNILTGNTLSGNDYGVNLTFGAADNTLIGNTAAANRIGFMIQGADVTGNTLKGNMARDNSTHGFLLAGFELPSGPHGNTLAGNTAIGNGSSDYSDAGFSIAAGAENTLTGNLADNNHAPGFRIEGANNTLTGNTAMRNDLWGYMVYGDYATGNALTGNVSTSNYDGYLVWNGASQNILDSNLATANSHTGFAAWNATMNTWTKNTARRNATYGFILIGGPPYCTGNKLESNTAKGNGTFDAYEGDPVGFNTWTNNNFGTTSGLG